MNAIMNTKHAYPRPKYAVTEAKKAELDALSIKVLNAKYEVEQLQAIVNSLQEKSTNFEEFLAQANADVTLAVSNKDSVLQVVQNAKELEKNSEIASNEMNKAKSKSHDLTKYTKKVIDELIYSAEIINKLAILIVRKKSLNPLISDELVSMVSKAGDDANNAVALALIALKSASAAYTSNVESDAIAALESFQAQKLYSVLTQEEGLLDVLQDSLTKANKNLEDAKIAESDTTSQLDSAMLNLNQAKIKLASLEASLAAANAAALAS